MINPIEAEELAKVMADQVRVRLSYHSVQLEWDDEKAIANFMKDILSNYVSTDLMSGDNQDAAIRNG